MYIIKNNLSLYDDLINNNNDHEISFCIACEAVKIDQGTQDYF